MKKPTYRPLSEDGIEAIHEASLQVLAEVGIVCGHPEALALFQEAGARIEGGRVYIAGQTVAAALAKAPKEVTLCGRDAKHDLRLGGTRVHMGTGGAALNVVDPETDQVRSGRLADIARLALLVDNLDYIDFFVRPTEPQDLPSQLADVNKYYAALYNTTKHVMSGVNDAAGMKQVVELGSIVAGAREKLRERPFVSFICCWMVSPLRIDPHSTELLLRAIEHDMPVVMSTAPMAGTTSPMTLAGTLVQSNAELLSGMVLAQAARPGAKALYGAVPSMSNLRDGSYLGGGPEFGMLNAAAAQMAQFYGLPIYNSAGLTESKCSDIQAGYEKAFSVLQAALAGANYIHHSAGMLEAMSTISYEQYVIDNEILGMARRCVEGIDTSEEALAVESIRRVGPGGNYLTDELTLDRMRSEIYNPTLSNRGSRAQWQAEGRPNIVAVARAKALHIIASTEPPGFAEDVDRRIRDQFDIRC